MLKCRVRIYEEKWHGRNLIKGKQLKQRTFKAKDWWEAEKVANDLWELYPPSTGMSLTILEH